MKTKTKKKTQDKATETIYRTLKISFPNISDDPSEVVYRYNPASIRVRIIDKCFDGKSILKREGIVMKALKDVPKMYVQDILLLLMLTPDEVDPNDPHIREFDNPDSGYL